MSSHLPPQAEHYVSIQVAMKRRMEDDSTVGGEKGGIVTHDNNFLEPLEQLAKEREEVAELVKKAKVSGHNHVNYDIEQNIREIRAILKMNAEIFDRCVKFMKSERGGTTYVYRIAYEVVTTRAWNNETQVITHPKRTDNCFNTDPLSKLPQGLEDIIVSCKMTGEKLSSFVDFDAIFKRSLIFHETVLEQFLPKLKEHLMSIKFVWGRLIHGLSRSRKEISLSLKKLLERKWRYRMKMSLSDVTSASAELMIKVKFVSAVERGIPTTTTLIQRDYVPAWKLLLYL